MTTIHGDRLAKLKALNERAKREPERTHFLDKPNEHWADLHDQMNDELTEVFGEHA